MKATQMEWGQIQSALVTLLLNFPHDDAEMIIAKLNKGDPNYLMSVGIFLSERSNLTVDDEIRAKERAAKFLALEHKMGYTPRDAREKFRQRRHAEGDPYAKHAIMDYWSWTRDNGSPPHDLERVARVLNTTEVILKAL